MELCIDAKQLRRAIEDIERAEANGFNYCLAVFKIISAGRMIDENRAEYDELIEKAHATSAIFNWGRGQNVTKDCKFVNDHLVPIEMGNP